MDLKELTKPLTADDIDFRIQSINKGGYATILAYKDARVDMRRLDSVCGPLNWKREHTRDNHNCVVSIWDDNKQQWVSKEDTGTESFTEAEKGLASDSFKRACFNWGIGRELYDFPTIQVKLKDSEFEVDGNRVKQTWNLKLREWRWRVDYEGSELMLVAAKDEKGNSRFIWEDYQRKYADSIQAIKDSIVTGSYSEGAEAWHELPRNAQQGLWLAKSSGGPFDQREKEIIRSSEFQLANGEPA